MEGKHYSPETLKNILQRYYDLPSMISAEFQAAHEAAKTLSAGLSPEVQQYVGEELREHMRCAGMLATQNRFLHDALFRLNPMEQEIVKYRLMGPKDPERRRKGFRLAPWKVIAQLVGISDSQARNIMQQSMKRLSELPVEPVTFESSGDFGAPKKEELS